MPLKVWYETERSRSAVPDMVTATASALPPAASEKERSAAAKVTTSSSVTVTTAVSLPASMVAPPVAPLSDTVRYSWSSLTPSLTRGRVAARRPVWPASQVNVLAAAV